LLKIQIQVLIGHMDYLIIQMNLIINLGIMVML